MKLVKGAKWNLFRKNVSILMLTQFWYFSNNVKSDLKHIFAGNWHLANFQLKGNRDSIKCFKFQMPKERDKTKWKKGMTSVRNDWNSELWTEIIIDTNKMANLNWNCLNLYFRYFCSFFRWFFSLCIVECRAHSSPFGLYFSISVHHIFYMRRRCICSDQIFHSVFVIQWYVYFSSFISID